MRLFGRSLLSCLPLAAVAVILGQLSAGYDLMQGREVNSDLASKDATWWLLYAIGTILSLVIWGAIVLRQQSIATAQPVSAARELGRAFARLPTMLWYLVLAILVLLGALVPYFIAVWLLNPPRAINGLLLTISILFASVLLFFTFPSLLVDQSTAPRSIDQSLRIARVYWRRTLVFFAAFVAAAVVLFAMAGLTIGLLAELALAVSPSFQAALIAVTVIFSAALIILFYSALMIVAYDDAKNIAQVSSAPSNSA